MTKLSNEQILRLHSMIIKQSGGLDGVRDNGLLDTALHNETYWKLVFPERLCWCLNYEY